MRKLQKNCNFLRIFRFFKVKCGHHVFSQDNVDTRNYGTLTDNISIVSAVRTPLISFPDGEEAAAKKLITFATEAAIKQAALPKEMIDGLHIITRSPVDSQTPLIALQSELLRKDIIQSCYSDDFKAIQLAIDKLKNGQTKSIIVTGMNFLSAKDLTNQTKCERFKLAASKDLYEAEIVPITVRDNKQIVTVSCDEIKSSKEGARYFAVAVALTKSEISESLNVKPLARLLNLKNFCGQDYSSLMDNLIPNGELHFQNIQNWKIDSNSSNFVSNSTNLSNSIPGIFESSMATSVPLQLIHLVHSLRAKEFGCSITAREDGSITGNLLENSNEISPIGPPLLTLYTKDSCPLCDELMEELTCRFDNEYRLEKIFIDQKENVRFLRLYRYDIPVLFFNGQFLCMHRLNSKLLRRKFEKA